MERDVSEERDLGEEHAETDGVGGAQPGVAHMFDDGIEYAGGQVGPREIRLNRQKDREIHGDSDADSPEQNEGRVPSPVLGDEAGDHASAESADYGAADV